LVGGLIYRSMRARRSDPINDQARGWVIVAAAVGAAIGSKLLHHLASPSELVAQLDHSGPEIAAYLMGGKTIVGGLLGGWLAVEWYKSSSGIKTRTGDLFALPLVVGTIIGRLGCMFAGPGDDTLGVATTVFWAVDFGDGVARHPTPLFEILFLLALVAVLAKRQAAMDQGRPWRWWIRPGDGFRLYLFSYLSFRFLVDFLKPYEVVLGLRIIQWACLFGLVLLVRDFLRARRTPRNLSTAS
jgi:phosphatidylglycerol---prolipoprotein diacylglyceryl transferase